MFLFVILLSQNYDLSLTILCIYSMFNSDSSRL